MEKVVYFPLLSPKRENQDPLPAHMSASPHLGGVSITKSNEDGRGSPGALATGETVNAVTDSLGQFLEVEEIITRKDPAPSRRYVPTPIFWEKNPRHSAARPRSPVLACQRVSLHLVDTRVGSTQASEAAHWSALVFCKHSRNALKTLFKTCAHPSYLPAICCP